jgi:phosphoserine aminotransferase
VCLERTGQPEAVCAFITESEAAGFIGLKGYRAVGGMRASLYNAVEQDSVDALVGFMREFERVRG